MKHLRPLLTLFFLLSTAVGFAGIFGNPTIALPLHNKPTMDMSKIQTAAVWEIANLQGETCGTELTERLENAISLQQGIEVVNRTKLQSVLGELNFQGSGMVDPAAMTQLGKIYPSSVFIYGRITRPCKQQIEHQEGGLFDYNETQTDVQVVAAIQVVDVQTTKSVLSKVYKGSGSSKTNAWFGKTAKSDEDTAESRAYGNIVTQFLMDWEEWNTTVNLTVYEDKNWGLKAGSISLFAGKYEDAVKQFRSSVQAGNGSTDSKMIAKANYDLGLALIFAGRSKEAKAYLLKSIDANPTDDAQTAFEIAGQLAQGSILLALNGQDIQSTTDSPTQPPVENETSDPNVVPPPPAKTSSITNAEILDMLNLKLSESSIIRAIQQATDKKIDASPQSLMAFKKAGATQALIDQIQAVGTSVSSSISNEQILSMLNRKMKPEAILSAIDGATEKNLDASPQALIALKKAGATQAIIDKVQTSAEGQDATTNSASVPAPVTPAAPKQQAPSTPPAEEVGPAKDILTNDDILYMAKHGASEQNIVAAIDTAKSVRFEMTQDKVNVLTMNGVSSNIINRMAAAKRIKAVH